MFLHTRVLVIIQPSVAIKPLFFATPLKHFVKKFPQAPENWSYARNVLCRGCMPGMYENRNRFEVFWLPRKAY